MYKQGLLVFGVALGVMTTASVGGEGPQTAAKCLPDRLAQWVKDMGADTALDQLPDRVAAEFRSGSPSPQAMLILLGEKVNVVTTNLPITVISGDHLVAVTKVIVADEAEGSRVIGIGEKVLPGDEILKGLVFNLPPDSASGDTSAVVEYGESTVVLDDGQGLLAPPCLTSCSVTCSGENAVCSNCGVDKCCACCACTGPRTGASSCTASCADSN